MKLKLSALALLLASANLYAQTEVRLAVHKSFSLPQSVIAQFEKANDAKVSVIKAGSGNEMLNKLILSKSNPIADAVYGLDNANIGKAKAAGILAANQPKSAPVTASCPMRWPSITPMSPSTTTKNGLNRKNCPCRKHCKT